MTEKPLLSIITVVLNNKGLLERTIKSVASQTYKNIEYIIVDGKSIDGTLDVIRKYKNSISAWISEPDKGIYDAMNKGLTLATGEFINFLNAGDLFYENCTLERIFQRGLNGTDLIYGDCEVVYSDRLKRIKKAGITTELWKGMIFSHQSLLTRSSILKKHRFDTSLTMGADFDFIFSMYLDGHKFYYTNSTISSVLVGGKSDKYCLQGAIDWWRVVRIHRNNIKIHAYYSLLMLSLSMILIIKLIFPKLAANLNIKFRSIPEL